MPVTITTAVCPRLCRSTKVAEYDPIPEGDLVWHAYTCKKGEVVGQLPQVGCKRHTFYGGGSTFGMGKRSGIIWAKPYRGLLKKDTCYNIRVICWANNRKYKWDIVVVADCTGKRPAEDKLPELPWIQRVLLKLGA